MKTSLYLLLLTIFLSTATFSQEKQPNKENNVQFVNLESEYQNLDDLKPLLKNSGNRSIFLFWDYPFKVQVLRFNDETKEWETGREGYFCATNMLATGNYGPLEIKPSNFFPVYLGWSIAFNNSKQFVLKGSDSHRPQKGKYKFKIPYSFEEWKLKNSPKTILEVESGEFFINPS